MGYMIDNFEIVEKLGSGAMGDVFKGRDPKTGEFVAIKILSEELSNNQRAVERFKREIRQTIQLDHPNIISAYTAGEFKGRLYYAMEYVEGTTIKKELLAKGIYDESRAFEVLMQMSSALDYAFTFGIIHRDIKPDNIMIAYDGKAKLCDMGLAKSTESDTKLTVMGTVLGTPHYMSPEQAQGEENLDGRTDIFSLGSTCYHMLTGAPPFDGPDPISIMTMLLEKEPTPILDRNPKVSMNACAIVGKMMAKDRAKRYQSFSEVLEDLKKLRKGDASISAEAFKPKPKPKLKFADCYIPKEEEILVGQIAVHNKLLVKEKIEESLNRQEYLYLTGINLTFPEVLLETKQISPQQKSVLDKAKLQFALDRGDDLFLKVSTGNKFLSTEELEECKRFKKSGRKGIAAIFLGQGKLSKAKQQKVYASIKHLTGNEEGKSVLKLCMDTKLISQQQAEKCSRIYSNNIVMGKYRSIGEIMVDKGFLELNAYHATLRAVRRTALTGKPAGKYLQEKKI